MQIRVEKFSSPNARNIESPESPDYLRTSYAKKPHRITPTPILKTEPADLGKEQNVRNFAFNLGHSYEAPSYMISHNSILDKRSYLNQYLEGSEKWPALSRVNNKLTNTNEFKINGGALENRSPEKSMSVFNIVSNTINKQEHVPIMTANSNQTLFQKGYRSLLDESPQAFHRKLGVFSDYVERNNMMTVYGPLLHNERTYQAKQKPLHNSTFEESKTKSKDKSSSAFKNFRIKTKNDRQKTTSTLVEPLERNTEKYLNHDQNYLNSINNHLIKMRIRAILNPENKNEELIYNNQRKVKGKYEEKMDPISEFEEKMLKMKNLYRKHIKSMKKEKTRKSLIKNNTP